MGFEGETAPHCELESYYCTAIISSILFPPWSVRCLRGAYKEDKSVIALAPHVVSSNWNSDAILTDRKSDLA